MDSFVEWLKAQELALANKEKAAASAGEPLADIFLDRGRVATALSLWGEYQAARGCGGASSAA